MEAAIGIFLQVITFAFLISAGAIIISFFLDVIIGLFDEHEGVYINRGKGEDKSTNKKVNTVKEDDKIVVYSDLPIPTANGAEEKKKEEVVNGEKVTSVDYDKAAEEQQALMAKNGGAKAPTFDSKPQFDQPTADNNIFMDDDDDDMDDEYSVILDEVVSETKRQMKEGTSKSKKKKVVEEDDDEDDVKEEVAVPKSQEVVAPAPVAPQKRKVIYKERAMTDEEKSARDRELEELKALREQQVQELEEFRKLKEDFAKEKEQQLSDIKKEGDNAKQEEIDRLRAELEEERAEIQRLRDSLNKEPEEPETIIQEKIIVDDEQIRKMKLQNLARMNARLTRILKSVDKVEDDKKKRIAKIEEQRRKLEEKKKYEEQVKIQKQQQLERAQKEYLKQKELKEKEEARKHAEREKQKKKQEELRSAELAKKEELKKRLLEPLEKKPSKYNLNTGAKSNSTTAKSAEASATEEIVTTETTEVVEVEHVTDNNHTTAKSTTVVKPNRATILEEKPLNPRDYYENRLVELADEMKEAEKELRVNKREYIPLTRIHKAYARDSEKLRKKELIVAKQKVALYGVNASKVDPVKKEKLNENLKQLAELKDSVEHCQEIIKKNKDRYPILAKNNTLINKHIAKIQEDIDDCNKAIEYYDKNNKKK